MLAFDRRAARITWTAFLVVAALAVVFAVRRTLLVFFLAVFFSYMIFPLVKRIEPMIPLRAKRLVATSLVFVLLAVAVTVVLSLIGPPLAGQASWTACYASLQVVNDPANIDRVPLPDWLGPYRAKMAEFVREHLPDGDSAVPIAKQVGQTALRLFGDMIYVVLIPILAFLFITNGVAMRDGFLELDRRGPTSTDVGSTSSPDLDKLLRPLHPRPRAALGRRRSSATPIFFHGGGRGPYAHRPRRARRRAEVHSGHRAARRGGGRRSSSRPSGGTTTSA